MARLPRLRAVLPWVLALALAACGGQDEVGGPTEPDLILFSTTTTRDSGVLEALEADFERRTGYDLTAVVAGSGEVLELARRGEGDVLLTHSPAAEEEFMAQGHGVRRELVMHNDFVLVGPAGDPGRIAGLAAPEALRVIAAAQAPFVSRGDGSGTHVKELGLWAEAGTDPGGKPWYTETGSGQGQTLNVAAERDAYALADRGTYLALEANLGLEILVERGSTTLLNLYHVITVDPSTSSKINAEGADAFADYVTSPAGQEVIASVGVAEFGEPLFVPDAGKTIESITNEPQ